jgi:hypothetical protein
MAWVMQPQLELEYVAGTGINQRTWLKVTRRFPREITNPEHRATRNLYRLMSGARMETLHELAFGCVND